MSTIIVAAVLTAIIAAITYTLVRIDQKQKQKAMNILLQQFSELGSKHGLSFSAQEILKNVVFGLDGIHRKILLLRRENGSAPQSLVIDLNDVTACSVRKYYGTIAGGALQGRGLEQYLQKLTLRFTLSRNLQPVEVTFFNHFEDNFSDIPFLQEKAGHWEAILSKMCSGKWSGKNSEQRVS